MLSNLKNAAKRYIPRGVYQPALNWLRFHRPIAWGSFHTLTPVGNNFSGSFREIVDRYYIESFLSEHRDDIRGNVLEVEDAFYAHKFGGAQVAKIDVLYHGAGHPGATIIADLAKAENIPAHSFDCIVLTQVLQYIYDIKSALAHIHRILKPGGVVLATVPGISYISRENAKRWGEYWHYTSFSARRLFEEHFPPDRLSVNARGNVMVATAYLHSLRTRHLKKWQLDFTDPDFEVVITIRAAKPL